MIDNQDREEYDDEDYGSSGNKKSKVPIGAFFMPHIDEEDELDNGLKKSKSKNNCHCEFIGKAKKFRLHNDEVGQTRECK